MKSKIPAILFQAAAQLICILIISSATPTVCTPTHTPTPENIAAFQKRTYNGFTHTVINRHTTPTKLWSFIGVLLGGAATWYGIKKWKKNKNMIRVLRSTHTEKNSENKKFFRRATHALVMATLAGVVTLASLCAGLHALSTDALYCKKIPLQQVGRLFSVIREVTKGKAGTGLPLEVTSLKPDDVVTITAFLKHLEDFDYTPSGNMLEGAQKNCRQCLATIDITSGEFIDLLRDAIFHNKPGILKYIFGRHDLSLENIWQLKYTDQS